jgi:hypothetical protein
MRANRETTAGAAGALRVESRGDRWRARWRFLLATLTLATLYLAIEQVWMWGALKLMYVGWTYSDPAHEYAEKAAAIAEQSKALEVRLGAHYERTVFELGIQYGYVSDSLVGSANVPEEQISALARRVLDRNPRDMQTNAQRLGLGTVQPLTAVNEIDLTQRLEDDVDGVAGHVDQRTSPRLRHLFMLGVHSGTQLSRLKPSHDVLLPARADLIGMHGTLAGVPEPLWRPLTRVSIGDEPFEHYRAAVDALHLSLADGASSPPAPP